MTAESLKDPDRLADLLNDVAVDKLLAVDLLLLSEPLSTAEMDSDVDFDALCTAEIDLLVEPE
ncbi:hypothetical protein [Lacticaseibacillus thailandensis]|uniref:hypothetical protein n=1 Tax=Lacticaseibacillus thailandensis TaxID=381741 RepID=UPI0006D18BF0|nr:hypothetical protein [Lacticaseibacillus thailandensis]